MSIQEHTSPPRPVLSVPEQIEWCYREHVPGQIQWWRWSKWMKARGRLSEVPLGERRAA